MERDLGFIPVFLTLIKPTTQTEVISIDYNTIQQCTQTIHKALRGGGGGTAKGLLSERWGKCRLQWNTTGSNIWCEFVWKNIVRYFIKPIQK